MWSRLTRVSLTAVIAAMLLGATASPAQAQIGLSAGLDFDSVEDIDTSTEDNATMENSTGYHVGVIYDGGVGPVHLRPGLFFRKVGTYEFPEDEYDVAAWEVPVDVRVTVIPTPVLSAYILGGPKASFPRSDGEFEEELEDVSFTFNVGVGAELELPGSGVSLQPELRYEFGATDYVEDDFEIGGITFEPDERKFSAIALRLNVVF